MSTYRSLVVAALLALQTIGLAGAPRQGAARKIDIRALSARPDRVTGGDVLIRVVTPGAGSPAVTLNGHDVSAAFHAAAGGGSAVGLVTNLIIGRNVLTVAGKPWGVRDESLQLTNYPTTGPVISGPPQTPFVCQTDAFKLPDGSTLGKATDANCSAPTKVQYVYLPKGATDFKPMAGASALPAHVPLTPPP